MTSLAVPVLLLLASGALPNRFEGSVGAGAGYDSNLDLASSGSGVASFGSTTLSFWADAGWAVEPSETTRVYVGARYDGVFFLDTSASDLTRNIPGADLALTYEPVEWLAFTLAPGVGYAFYGDPARDAVKLGVRATVRVRPWSWLSLRAGYARTQTWASDPIFSLGTDRILASAEVRLARRTYLAGGYTVSFGDQVFYQTVTSVMPGTGGMGVGRGRASSHAGSGMFSTLLPYQSAATEHALSLRWEQGIWRELYYTVSYEYTLGHSDEGDYSVHSVFGAVGYRF